MVELFLWPNEDHDVYFEYELSPYDFELPLMVNNINGKFYGWLPWHYEGKRRVIHKVEISTVDSKTRFWTASIFIPFELLRPLISSPPTPGEIWRANFYRIDYDHEMSTWQWQPIKKSFHEFEKFGYMKFQ